MKVLISILVNAFILFLIWYFMPAWVREVWWMKLYFIWWVVLWILNSVIRPILKIIWFPFLILTFWLFIFVINGVILFLLQKIILGLNIEWVTFEINWFANFVIAVAIFTVFNTIYNTFLKS